MTDLVGQDLDKFLWKYKAALNYLEESIGSYVESISNNGDSPIEHYKGRIKDIDSIKEKLNRRGLEFTKENIENNLTDIAGVRIVCNFKNDLYKIKEFILQHPLLEVCEVKDYVTNPKKSGYSSYHVIVKVPVIDNGQIIFVPAEIQLRTLAMDWYASLEHKVIYKKGRSFSEETFGKVSDFAKSMRLIDDMLYEFISKYTKDEKENKSERRNAIGSNVLSKYEVARKKLDYIISGIANDFGTGEDCPIEHIKSRLKSIDSICEKLEDKNLDITEYNIENNLKDVVGFRIVCSFFNDMNVVIAKILQHEELRIVEIKDYISNPKKNGYSSFHIIVAVPIFYKGKWELVNAEIQVRTKGMNVWASLHHKFCYKKDIQLGDIQKKLSELADIISEIDRELNIINSEAKQDDEDLSNIKKKKLIKNK